MTQPPRRLPPDLDPRRRPVRRRARRAGIVSIVAGVLSAVVLIGSVTGYGFYRYYNSQINRLDINLPGKNLPSGGAQNFLLIGSDSRAGVPAGFAGGPSESHGFGLSDTVILAHVPSNGRATLVSFPRDSWVLIPAYRTIAAHHAKLNSAFSEGGPSLLVRVIESLSGMRIDHVIDIDFVGFMRMVNALGGVTLCIGTSRHDVLSGDYLTAGIHHVNGEQALAFVRDRHAFANEDFSRIKDQQYFLSVVLRTVLSAGTLINPFKLNGFLTAGAGAVSMDRGLTFSTLRDLAFKLRHIDPAHVTFVTVPVANPNVIEPDGEDAVELDTAGVTKLFDGLKNTGTPAAPSARHVPLDPAKVAVQVLNGAGIPGLAFRTENELRAQHFDVTSIGNAGSGATRSVVQYGPGRTAAAATLAAAIEGGVTTSFDPALSGTLVLVVGSSYAGVRTVQGPGAVSSGPARHASPAPQASPTSAAQPACAP